MSNSLLTWIETGLGSAEGKIFGYNPIPQQPGSGSTAFIGPPMPTHPAASTNIPGMVGSGLIGLVAGGVAGFLTGRATAGKRASGHRGYHKAKSGPHKGQLVKTRHRTRGMTQRSRRNRRVSHRKHKNRMPAALKRYWANKRRVA